MTNEDVVRAWAWGRPLSSKHLITDGNNLFSYNLKIGYTVGNTKIVYDYTAEHDNFVSMTTSHHVGLAKRYSDRININPPRLR